MSSDSTRMSAISNPVARTQRLRIAVSALLAPLALVACATGGMADDDAPVSIAARLDGEIISLDELDQWIKDEMFRRELDGAPDAKTKLYEMRREGVDRMINERVLESAAQTSGLEPEALITAKQKPVSDDEVKAFYEEHKERIKDDVTLKEVTPSIRSYLKGQQRAEVIAGLRSAASVMIELERPRVSVDGSGPSRGPTTARVVIVEFSDYQCPYCSRVEPTLNELITRYPEDVRWEYRHYPLPGHPAATPAAEAAVCAEAQGKFWEYHAKLFSGEAEFDAAGFRWYAKAVGLELEQFEACLQAPDTRARVAADLAAGQRAGARGTPAFFVNGIFLSGALPIEEFEKLIQSELARVAP